MFIRNVIIVVAVLAAVQCDPEGEAAGRKVVTSEAPAKAAPAKSTTAPTPVPASTPASAVPAGPAAPAGSSVAAESGGAGSEFAKCLLACDDAKVKPADRAKCRYDCDRTPVGGAAGVVDSDPVEYVMSCFDRCPADGKADACLAGCKTTVAGAPAAPSTAVLDALGSCLVSCRGSKLNETDHATCELNCAQTARAAGPAKPLAPAGKTGP